MLVRYLRWTNILKLDSKWSKTSFRFLRKIASPGAKVNVNASSTVGNLKSIKVIEESLDLSASGNSSLVSKLPTIVRLAIQNDPNLLKSNGCESLVNEKGEIAFKKLEFSFDAKAKLVELSKKKSKQILQTKANEQISDEKTINDIIEHRVNVNHTKSKEEDTNIEKQYEDPQYPKSKVACSGCGAMFHCQVKHSEGFLPANVLKKANKNELKDLICERCNYINRSNKLVRKETIEKFEYDKFIMEQICSESKVHVILLIDLLDMPNSIYDGWSKLIEKRNIDKDKDKNYDYFSKNKTKPNEIDIIILGSKFDLLPNTGTHFRESVMQCLIANCEKKGIYGSQIKYVDVISAKNGYNIEKVISNMFRVWNDEGDVYLLGMANAGKSVLYNQLLKSDYCRTLASSALNSSTTSFWPGTTINFLKFPITFLNSAKASVRRERLQHDRNLLANLEERRKDLYEKNHNLRHAECFGIVGSSFKPYSTLNDEINSEVEASYTLDEKTGMIMEGENFEKESDIFAKYKNDAKSRYDPKLFEDKSTWFYDTPGVLSHQQLLINFSKQELQIALPIAIIMPRIFMLKPGETLLVGGLMRVDLLESSNNETVLFSIMASPALPIITPFKTTEAEKMYEKHYKDGSLRVPFVNHVREKPLPKLEGKVFEIDCIGNHQSTTDLVFSCFGFMVVNSKPNTTAVVKAYTLGAIGLEKRTPSLLPYICNMRQHWIRLDQSQSFKSVLYKKPKNY